jgi:hypothetical protein
MRAALADEQAKHSDRQVLQYAMPTGVSSMNAECLNGNALASHELVPEPLASFRGVRTVRLIFHGVEVTGRDILAALLLAAAGAAFVFWMFAL